MLTGTERIHPFEPLRRSDPARHPRPHRLTETGDVVEPDLKASVADRHDAAIRGTPEFITGLHTQKQAGPVCRDGTDGDAFDTERRIRAVHPHHRNKT
jgi:hypothetical protein